MPWRKLLQRAATSSAKNNWQRVAMEFPAGFESVYQTMAEITGTYMRQRGGPGTDMRYMGKVVLFGVAGWQANSSYRTAVEKFEAFPKGAPPRKALTALQGTLAAFDVVAYLALAARRGGGLRRLPAPVQAELRSLSLVAGLSSHKGLLAADKMLELFENRDDPTVRAALDLLTSNPATTAKVLTICAYTVMLSYQAAQLASMNRSLPPTLAPMGSLPILWLANMQQRYPMAGAAPAWTPPARPGFTPPQGAPSLLHNPVAATFHYSAALPPSYVPLVANQARQLGSTLASDSTGSFLDDLQGGSYLAIDPTARARAMARMGQLLAQDPGAVAKFMAGAKSRGIIPPPPHSMAADAQRYSV